MRFTCALEDSSNPISSQKSLSTNKLNSSKIVALSNYSSPTHYLTTTISTRIMDKSRKMATISSKLKSSMASTSVSFKPTINKTISTIYPHTRLNLSPYTRFNTIILKPKIVKLILWKKYLLLPGSEGKPKGISSLSPLLKISLLF